MARSRTKLPNGRRAEIVRCRRLQFEPLEPRLALDSQGVLAGIDSYLTLSFAADGVSIAGQSNALSAKFDSIASSAVWKEQILRAFQTWAVETNADIGLVPDTDVPFGSPSAQQFDSRFGDVRIGAIATSPEVGGVSVPITNPASGSWLADVIFNSNFSYQSVDDIFAVALHEAGNVFGLPDSTDPNSPLYTGGPPAVHAPTADDVLALQQLLGVRSPDSNESHRVGVVQYADNDSLAQATKLSLVEPVHAEPGAAPSVVYGDIGSLTDADYFSFTTPAEYIGSLSVDLRSAGISLLKPDLTIYDSSGQIVDHESSSAIGGDHLTIRIPAAGPHAQYYIRVAGANVDVFGIGGYSLVAKLDSINVVDQATIDSIAGGTYRHLSQQSLSELIAPEGNEFINDDAHANDAAALGTELETTPGFASQTRYSAVASISDSTDIDYYIVKSPLPGSSAASVLTISLRSLQPGGLIPDIMVLDEDLHTVPTETLVNGGGELIVQLSGIAADADYRIGVLAANGAGPFQTGNYELTAVFNNSAVTLETLAQGSVGGANQGNIHTLYVGRAQLFQLLLDAQGVPTSAPTAVVATIKNADAQVVAVLASPPGKRSSIGAVLLEPGTYLVEVVVLTLDQNAIPTIDYTILGKSISDPFVTDPNDPNSHPFACTDPNLSGYFCYPGNIITANPFLWDDFIYSLPEPPPPVSLPQLIELLMGSWWSWYWQQDGTNGPPLSRSESYSTGPNVALNVGAPDGVLANDIEPEGDPMVAVMTQPPRTGTFQFNSDGSFQYIPPVDFSGVVSFVYQASDFRQLSNEVRVTIVIGIAGDYDHNGSVTPSDYNVWRRDYGSASQFDADGNGDGVVDTIDYLVWRHIQSLDVGALLATSGEFAASTAAAGSALPAPVPGSVTNSSPGITAVALSSNHVVGAGKGNILTGVNSLQMASDTRNVNLLTLFASAAMPTECVDSIDPLVAVEAAIEQFGIERMKSSKDQLLSPLGASSVPLATL